MCVETCFVLHTRLTCCIEAKKQYATDDARHVHIMFICLLLPLSLFVASYAVFSIIQFFPLLTNSMINYKYLSKIGKLKATADISLQLEISISILSFFATSIKRQNSQVNFFNRV